VRAVGLHRIVRFTTHAPLAARTLKMDAKAIAADPRTREGQRRARIETVVQDRMHLMSGQGIHSGTVLDADALEVIAANLRALISKYDPPV